MLEQMETIVVMLTEVLFEKEQMLIKSNEKKMSGAAGAQSMCCRGALSVRGVVRGWRQCVVMSMRASRVTSASRPPPASVAQYPFHDD